MVSIHSLVRSDVAAFGHFDAAIIAKKKRKLTFQECYFAMFGRFPKVV